MLLALALVASTLLAGCTVGTGLPDRPDRHDDASNSVTLRRPVPPAPILVDDDVAAFREVHRILPGTIVAVARTEGLAAAADERSVTLYRIDGRDLHVAGTVIVGGMIQDMVFLNDSRVAVATRGGHAHLIDISDPDAPGVIDSVSVESVADGRTLLAPLPNGSLAIVAEMAGRASFTVVDPDLNVWRNVRVPAPRLYDAVATDSRIFLATGDEVLVAPIFGSPLLIRLTPGYGERGVYSLDAAAERVIVGFIPGAHFYRLDPGGEPRRLATANGTLNATGAWQVVLAGPGPDGNATGFLAVDDAAITLFDGAGVRVASALAPAGLIASGGGGFIASDGSRIVLGDADVENATVAVGTPVTAGAETWYFSKPGNATVLAAGGRELVRVTRADDPLLAKRETLLTFDTDVESATFGDGRGVVLLANRTHTWAVMVEARNDGSWMARGQIDMPGGGQVVLAHDRVYHMPIREGKDRRVITVLDVSDADTPTVAGDYRFEDAEEFVANFMRLANGTIAVPGRNGLLVLDAHDAAAITRLGSIVARGATDVIANDTGGLAIMEVGGVRGIIELVWRPTPQVVAVNDPLHTPHTFYNRTHYLGTSRQGHAVIAPNVFDADPNATRHVALDVPAVENAFSIARPFEGGMLVLTPGNGLAYYEWRDGV